MKQLLLGVMIVCATVAVADDAPHWIGLDTTLRDQKAWVAPTETACAASLDTRIYDALASVGETIRGVFTGLFFIVK